MRLGFLAAALAAAFALHCNAAAVLKDPPALDESGLSSWNCSIGAWVRAPDLSPNVVVPGDARLVLNGTDCADVRRWTVGLRLKERAVVKLRAPGIELPERPQYNATADIAYWDEMEMSRSRSIFDVAEDFGGYERSPMRLAEKAYATALANRSLWEAHAEERVAFDSKLDLHELSVVDEIMPLRQVRSFSIAVPNVNFPPQKGDDYFGSHGHDAEFSYAESRFEFYFSLTLRNVCSSAMVPVTVRRIRGTGSPRSISLSPQTHSNRTWAGTFAHSPEQARLLQRGRSTDWEPDMFMFGGGMRMTRATIFNRTMHEAAEKLLKRRKEHLDGAVYSSWSSGREGFGNATSLDPELAEQIVLVNITVPKDLFPSARTTFVTYNSKLHVSLQVAHPRNGSSDDYPYLDEIEDDEAWSEHPYKHVDKLVNYLSAVSNRANTINFSGNTTLVVVSRLANAACTANPVSYLDASARAPLLLPNIDATMPDEAAFPRLSFETHDETRSGDEIVPVKYAHRRRPFRPLNNRYDWQLAGTLWNRKIARNAEYATRTAHEREDAKAAFVVQA
ncbi:hypothetical protein Rhopal_003387-T1 [Rhodotorula paludigena]|uniref:Uncharacterized protein n=1 Tax=Rhodotorula paludigena TaxID=86838 RepID=A0AAV5GCT8_9BASI|nr:hypothetical protein Rhopal_003387-T1 [Rhodotorula paludigena]